MDGDSCNCTGGRDQNQLKKKKCKKAKWLSEETSQIVIKEEKLNAKEKRRDISIECRVPKNCKKR